MSIFDPERIYHITPRADWEAAQRAGIYRADTLETQGFIHCSTGAQVINTANVWFPGQQNLLLLEIDPRQAGAEIRYEGLAGVEMFPHLYGPLPLAAVTRILRLEPDAEGKFTAPFEDGSV